MWICLLFVPEKEAKSTIVQGPEWVRKLVRGRFVNWPLEVGRSLNKFGQNWPKLTGMGGFSFHSWYAELNPFCCCRFRMIAYWVGWESSGGNPRRANGDSQNQQLQLHDLPLGTKWLHTFFWFWGSIFGNYHRKLYSNNFLVELITVM